MGDYISFDRKRMEGHFFWPYKNIDLYLHVDALGDNCFQIVVNGCSDKTIFEDFNIENVAKMSDVELKIADQIIFYKSLDDVEKIVKALNMLYNMKYDEDSKGIRFFELNDKTTGRFANFESGKYEPFAIRYIYTPQYPPYRLTMIWNTDNYLYRKIGMSVDEIASLAMVEVKTDENGFIYYNSVEDIYQILTVLNYLYYLKVVNRKPDDTPPYIYAPYLPMDNCSLCKTDVADKKIITSRYALADTGIKYNGSFNLMPSSESLDIKSIEDNIKFMKDKLYEASRLPKDVFYGEYENDKITLDFE